jgi:hypothetical protein
MSFVALFSRLQHRQRTLKGDQRTRKEEKRRCERREARFLFVSLSLSVPHGREKGEREKKERKREKNEKKVAAFSSSLSPSTPSLRDAFAIRRKKSEVSNSLSF